MAQRTVGGRIHLRAHLAGFVFVAFVIDAYARRIVGGKVSTSAPDGFVLDPLDQSIHARRPGPQHGLVHHRDRGVHYLGMNYTLRLAEANLAPSMASLATATTMPWPRLSMASIKQRSFGDSGRGQAHRQSKRQPCAGSTGAKTNAFSAPSATFRPPRPKQITMQPKRPSIWLHDSIENAPGKPGRFKHWLPGHRKRVKQ